MQLQRPQSRFWAEVGEPLTPSYVVLCTPQLKLEEDMGYLREEMTKTEKLQAQEEQTLAEWQVGAGAGGSCSPSPTPFHLTGLCVLPLLDGRCCERLPHLHCRGYSMKKIKILSALLGLVAGLGIKLM